MIILSLFFSYRSWVLFPPLGEICTSLRHNQHTSNNLHLHTPGPAAEWWIVQVCKNKKQKKNEENSYHSSCSLLLFCVREITSHREKKKRFYFFSGSDANSLVYTTTTVYKSRHSRVRLAAAITSRERRKPKFWNRLIPTRESCPSSSLIWPI